MDGIYTVTGTITMRVGAEDLESAQLALTQRAVELSDLSPGNIIVEVDPADVAIEAG
ncbi:hypothetical protein GCM10007897_15260 [Sphingobium jiangsuense]|uniref:Uncharacterized protein n=1 Tax=Sphingobium jiangsuense TaxID=870476 RepID=A0A7W6BLW7_9SPHN|nr:hypothetical protein [Sphingobium jiangsuense]MBB3925028.1 hypothetical protein [Sphingobium jiangsuense]GLT00142.1 hypothetical protein GCM10007897_15260 [Sphingobium jiangsuense]